MSFGYRKRRPAIGVISLAGHLDEAAALSFLLKVRAIPGGPRPIAALIVRVASNGGSMGAAQTIHEGLESLREEMDIPSVSLITETALSAGFYAALGADFTVAAPAATLGNVGAAIRTFSPRELLDRLGIEYLPVVSGHAKDSLANLGALDVQQRALLQSVVDQCGEQFLAMIQARRPTLPGTVIQSLRSGHIFTGATGHCIGLVDHLGGLFRAIRLCGELSDLEAPTLQFMDDSPEGESLGIQGLIRRQVVHIINRLIEQ